MAKPPLTLRQHQVFLFVRNYIEDRDLSPTMREIGDALGISKPSVYAHLQALVVKGYLEKRGGGKRVQRAYFVREPSTHTPSA